MAKIPVSTFVFCAVVVAAILGIYLPGLHNELIFDDLRLTDGAIFGHYGSLLEFKQRMLSYGSFVWVQQWLGDGWWKQRLVNIGLHMGATFALYGLLKELLVFTRFPDDMAGQAYFEKSRRAALQVGVALFALNPVAVYAVAYLVQRSIVMATFFAILACWLFVRALVRQRPWLFALALLCYVAAVLSKEHAAMAAAMAVPLYIYIRRPGWKRTALIVGISALVLGLVAAAFFRIYGHLIGTVFDLHSRDMMKQLDAIQPGVSRHMYPLSVLNEAALFLAYGTLWFVPNVMWMSLDIRPAFPLGYTAPLDLLGAASYVALLVLCIWLVLRKRGPLALAGLCMLFPLLFYVTEFATVWVQDPFVLYRSYLWAVGFPALVAIVLTGFKPRTIYVLGTVVGIAFAGLAVERVMSLRDDFTTWSDAAEKTDMQAPANAVGRWRSFLNVGAYHLDKGSLVQAEEDFAMANKLGEPRGAALFNRAAALQQEKKHSEALVVLAQAEAKGYTEPSLYYARGESQFALNQPELAYQSFSAAMQAPVDAAIDAQSLAQMHAVYRLRRAEAAIGAEHYDVALADM
ncbi:MAG TPA: hypothetical protein VGC24_08430, partial [Burkholderiaceae bacterium]